MNRINLIEENPQRGKENKNKQKHNFIKKEAKTLLNIKFEEKNPYNLMKTLLLMIAMTAMVRMPRKTIMNQNV